MRIEWDPDKMATGVTDVDKQHQEWIRRFNAFEDAIQSGHGLEEVKNALSFFVSYVDTHFELEEARMDELNCPAADLNREDHEKMRIILAGLDKYMAAKEATIIEVAALRDRMYNWLVNHILSIDIQLRDVAK